MLDRLRTAGVDMHMFYIRSLAITFGMLLGFISHASLTFARGGPSAEDRWNPEHINQLPTDIQNAIGRMCVKSPRAEHYFAIYFENSRLIVLHFEHFRCGDQRALCTQTGCLHQIYISTGGRYRLMKSYYGSEND